MDHFDRNSSFSVQGAIFTQIIDLYSMNVENMVPHTVVGWTSVLDMARFLAPTHFFRVSPDFPWLLVLWKFSGEFPLAFLLQNYVCHR